MASLKVIFALALLAGVVSAAIDFSKPATLNVLMQSGTNSDDEGCGASESNEAQATISTNVVDGMFTVTGDKVLQDKTYNCESTPIDTFEINSSSSDAAMDMQLENFIMENITDYESQIMLYNCTLNYGSSSSSSSDDSMTQLLVVNGIYGALMSFQTPSCLMTLNTTADLDYDELEIWVCGLEQCGFNGGVILSNFTNFELFGIDLTMGVADLEVENFATLVKGNQKTFKNIGFTCAFFFLGFGYVFSGCESTEASVTLENSFFVAELENEQKFLVYDLMDEDETVCFVDLLGNPEPGPTPNPGPDNYSRLVSFALGLLVLAFGAQAL